MSDDIVNELRNVAAYLRKHEPASSDAVLGAADEIERLRAAIDAVAVAIKVEGPVPQHHRRTASRQRHEWPTLWRAIDGLLEARRG